MAGSAGSAKLRKKGKRIPFDVVCDDGERVAVEIQVPNLAVVQGVASRVGQDENGQPKDFARFIAEMAVACVFEPGTIVRVFPKVEDVLDAGPHINALLAEVAKVMAPDTAKLGNESATTGSSEAGSPSPMNTDTPSNTSTP